MIGHRSGHRHKRSPVRSRSRQPNGSRISKPDGPRPYAPMVRTWPPTRLRRLGSSYAQRDGGSPPCRGRRPRTTGSSRWTRRSSGRSGLACSLTLGPRSCTRPNPCSYCQGPGICHPRHSRSSSSRALTLDADRDQPDAGPRVEPPVEHLPLGLTGLGHKTESVFPLRDRERRGSALRLNGPDGHVQARSGQVG
jgi:hypothetical protein